MSKKHVAVILVILANLCVGSAQIVPQYSIQTVDWEPAVFKGIPYQPVEQKTQGYRTNSSSTRNKSVEVGDSWTVSEIFEKKKAKSGTKALGSYNNIIDVEYLLVPCSLNSGNYKITIRRETSNLYEIVGEDMFIELSGVGIFEPCSVLMPTTDVILTKEGYQWKIYEIK